MPEAEWKSIVVAVRDITPNVRELILDPPGDQFGFVPGQWISLHLPVGEKPPLVRAYSLAAAPAADGRLVLCFDHVPAGLGSDYLFALSPGDMLEFSGPLGRFILPDEDRNFLWAARYTGIVPFRCMLQEIGHDERPPHIRLLYSVPNLKEAPYLDEIQRMSDAWPGLELHLLEEEDAEEAGDSAFTLTLSTLREMQAGEDWGAAGPCPMVCGRHNFVQTVRGHLASVGYGRRDILWEYYD